jgi:hypothetical protein
MKKTIEIDGKEFQVLGMETKGDSFGIHTDIGTKGGTFWMKPCEPMPGQKAFWMGEKGFVVELPPECPQRISRVTFDAPDLTDQFPKEVEADYQAYKTHCEKTGEKMLSLEQYKARVAVSDVWKRHGTPELALQHGYFADDCLIYDRNLEGQKIDPACLHKFKWAAEYMDEAGRGTFIFFERLAGPDPLPVALMENESNTRDKVVFSKGFTVITSGPLNVSLRPRHTDKALCFLYKNINTGWCLWSDVVTAADNPTAWADSRNPLRHLHSGKDGAKKDLFEKIIETRKNSSGADEVRLNPKYRFEEQ